MEFITIHDLALAAIPAARAYFEVNGALAAAIVQQAVSPLHDLNPANVLASIGAVVILWRKKGWIFSGVIHSLR